MRCTDPRTVGFHADGKTISWSPKSYSKEFATFELPCGQCLECRLDYARQWAVRCVHEAQMYENNSFITLTYDDENLSSDKLYYVDFQLFMKRLRDKQFRVYLKNFGKENWSLLSKQQKKEHYERIAIGIFVTGEYGDKKKRPHWHACVFNWRPEDAVYKYSNDRGDKVYSSQILSDLWGKGLAEFGNVTFESAGYCARYAAKKIVHGKNRKVSEADYHEYQPISKKSSRQAIGKKWLEKFWPDVFNYGQIVLPNGETCSIPRYYEKWLKKNFPEEHSRYVTQTKQSKIEKALEKQRIRLDESLAVRDARVARGNYQPQISENEMRSKITKSKFKQLQEKLKL